MVKPEIFRDKRVLITGASGFIGRHLLRKLQTYESHLSTISRKKNDFPGEVTQYILDIKDTRAVGDCFGASQPDYIFHLAAYKERNETIEGFYSSIETNLIGTLNVFSASQTVSSLKAIVTLGTAEEYGNNSPPFDEQLREYPVTPYSFSKTCISHMAELFRHLYGLPVIIIRPTLAYGPGQGNDMFLPSLICTLLENKPFEMTPGDQTRDFIYIDDLVDALVLSSLNKKAQGQIINIGSGVPVKLADIAKKTEAMIGRRGLINLGGKSYRNNEVMEYYIDPKKASDILGWRAKTSMDDGLKETIAYYRGVNGL